MNRLLVLLASCGWLGLALGISGCSSAANSGAGTAAKSGGEEPVVLLEPYSPPTLEELNAKVTWVDRPVLDAMELLRARQAQEKPLATAAEALAMKNDSPQANEKILSALGRLPEKDSDVNWDATCNRYIESDIKTTNPLLMSTVPENDVLSLTNFGLFSFDWNLKPFATKETVESWQSSQDLLYDKVVMRKDLTWSDGKPITAHDVVFSFKTIMDPRVPVPAQRSGCDKIRWIEAYDDYTLVFFHKEPFSTNIWNVNFSVVPQHIYESTLKDDPTMSQSEAHVKLENQPVCGGPYKITSRLHGQEIVVERREEWYMVDGKQGRDKPYFKTVRFRVLGDPNTILLALKSGDLDEAVLTSAQWTTQTNDESFYRLNTKASGLEWTYFYFGWNMKTPYFSDKRVRQAMSYAVNYDELMNKTLYGLYERCGGIFHSTAWMAPKNQQLYKQDLDKAEKLLDEADWKDHDGDGVRDKMIDGKSVPFEFSILAANIPDRIAICTLLKESLDQIGIVCHVRPMEFTVLQQKMLDHDFHASFGGWGTGADPDTNENIWGTGEMRNFVQYSNPKVDELFAAGRKEFDQEKRGLIYAQIAEQITDDQPYTFLYYRASFYGFNKGLRGYVFSPRGPFHYGPGFSSMWKAVP